MSHGLTTKPWNHRWSSKRLLSCETIILNMFFYFQKILGLVPFTLQQSYSTRKIGNVRIPSSSKLLPSRFYQFYNFVLMVLMIVTRSLSVPFLKKFTAHGDALIQKMEIVMVFMSSMVVLLIWGNVASKQHDVIKIYNRIKNVDDGMHMFRDIHLPETIKRRICRIFLSNSMLWFSYFLIGWIGKHRILSWFGISTLVPFFVSNWFVIQYVSVLISIEARLISLNRSFILLTKSSMGPIFHESQESQIHPQKSINEKFFALKQVYSIYSEVCREISDYYSLPLLFITVHITGTFLYVSYSLFESFFYSFDQTPIFLTIFRGIVITIYMSSLVIMSTGVTKVKNQIKKTSGIVYRELSQSIVSFAAKDELRKFSVELLHRKVDFTAYRIFSLDISLIQSIFGTFVTYMVIIIQYKATKTKELDLEHSKK